MGSEEAETRAKYERVCRELNLDQLTMDTAWKDYKSINEDYVLEGSCIEWLGCALYVAGQSTFQETVEGGHSSGNKVSLTQILRATKLSLIEFFRKIKKWAEMAKLSSDFVEKVETLERKFEVASIIFDKYRKEFCDIFQCPEDKQTPGGVRQCGRKGNKLRPYSTLDLFKYGWVLYVHIKSQFPLISDDLVNSHHLLLCCIDMLFGASLVRRRKDLLNPSSFLIPEGFNFDSTECIQLDEIPCILSELCNKYRGIEKDCCVIRDYHWRPAIKKLFEHTVLVPWNQTLDESIAAMLSAASFYANDKSVNGKYELKMLTEGEFDERIFLLQNASEEIGTPPRAPLGVNGARLIMGASYQGSPQVQFGTPLMNREYLPSKEPKLTPISDAAHTVDQLCTLLEGCPPEPSDHLVKAFSSCAINPYPVIGQRMVAMSEQFLEEFKYENQASQETFAQVRLRLSQSLYYKLLDGIVSDEEKKKTMDTRGTSTLQAMLEYEVFHKSLFALCVEVVLYSYNCQSRAFPWVLELYGISPYHFYRVIEVVIRAEYETSSEGFPRGIVKHLNRVEEMVLSHLAWKSDSPFFNAVDTAGSVPSYEEVAPSSPSSLRTLSSPFPLPPMRTPGKGGFDSPLSTGPSDHILSPGSGARRQLFSPNSMPSGKKMTAPSKMAPRTIAPKPSGSIQIGGVTATPLGKVTSTLALQMMPPSTTTITTTIATSHQDTVQHGASINMAAISSSAGTQTSPVLHHSSTTKPPVSEEMEGGPGNHHSEVDLEEALASLPQASPPRSHSIQMSPLVKFSVSAQSGLTGPQADPHVHRPSQATPFTSPPKPKRSGSLALFYRKVYQLAFVRIKDLCERLNLPCETQQKVWTCFEHVMKLTPDLMRDRHMDQLIMCSVYVLSKVLRLEITFQEIMRQYRHQPQAKSHVYRNVLLNNGPRKPPPAGSVAASSPIQPPPPSSEQEPSEQAASSTPIDQLLYRTDVAVGSRGDIIMFYNKVFIGLVKDYVLRFTPNEPDQAICAPTLSPLPVIRKTSPSPRKLAKHLNIFISPYKAGAGFEMPSASFTGKPYIIGKSSNMDLSNITKALASSRKRSAADSLLASPMEGSPAKRPHMQAGAAVQHKPALLMQQILSVANDRASIVKQPPPRDLS